MSLPATIRKNHQEIADAANALRRALKAGSASPDLGHHRMTLANVAREKLSLQQAIVSQIDPAKRRQIAAFDRVMEEDRELRLCYSQHVAKWNSRAIERDFAAYAASVEVLVDRLERHMRIFETDIYEPAFKLLDIAA